MTDKAAYTSWKTRAPEAERIAKDRTWRLWEKAHRVASVFRWPSGDRWITPAASATPIVDDKLRGRLRDGPCGHFRYRCAG